MLDGYQDSEAWIAGTAERAFVGYLNGGCSSPVAAYACVDGETLKLRGLYYREETDTVFKDSITDSIKDPESVGIALAQKLLKKAGN